jgi:hypothetical protein
MNSIKETLRPIDFLKSMGFGLDEKPRQLERMLLKSLSAEDRRRFREIVAREPGSSSRLMGLYRLPKTRKQAALLFSTDWPRANAAMKWFDYVVRKVRPRSIVEMGCGAGFLLKYLQTTYPNLVFQGLDAANNLIDIGSQLCGRALIAENYLVAQPDHKYDLIVCDFGFDLTDFTSSNLPHTTERAGEFEYCRNCSDHFKLQFDPYLQAWRRWAHDQSCLSFTGRIGNFGMLRAFILSAYEVGWVLVLSDSSMLKVKHNGIGERFPALLFQPLAQPAEAIDFSAIGQFFTYS